MKVNKHSLQQNTELCGKKTSHDAEHDGIQLFPFEHDLAEKRPYKHRGNITHFLTGLYCNLINVTLCWVFTDLVTYTHTYKEI